MPPLSSSWIVINKVNIQCGVTSCWIGSAGGRVDLPFVNPVPSVFWAV